MKVVHLSHTDGGAGAGRAAYRIHTALRGLGVDSKMLVSQKRTADASVLSVTGSGLVNLHVRLSEYLEAKAGARLAVDPTCFLSASKHCYFKPAQSHAIQNADVVTAYWVNGGFISPEGLGAMNKPLVWRLSDVWPFTGGCHYPGTCRKFEVECGGCPQMRQSNPKDSSNSLWLRKSKAWKDIDLTVVAPSNWIGRLAQQSSLFGERPVTVIPTGVDLNCYRPDDRLMARAYWGLPKHKRVILFGSLSPQDDVRKGYNELFNALKILAGSPLAPDVHAVVFGSNTTKMVDSLPVPATSLGRLDTEQALALAYNCADLVVVPSIEDNLPNVGLEAIACGAPVLAFDVCGMPDIVIDGWNGRLASHIHPGALGHAMVRLLSDEDALLSMRLNARKHAVDKFSLEKQAQAFHALYEHVIERKYTKEN